MSQDFNSYINNNKKPENQDGKAQNAGQPDIEMLKQFAGQYQGKNEDEVMRDILKMAKEGKKNGTLSNADIDKFVAMIAPMLDDKKKKKLYQIADRLKD